MVRQAHRVRQAHSAQIDLGVVWCGKHSAQMNLGVVWCGRHSAQIDLGVVWCGRQFGAAGTVLR